MSDTPLTSRPTTWGTDFGDDDRVARGRLGGGNPWRILHKVDDRQNDAAQVDDAEHEVRRVRQRRGRRFQPRISRTAAVQRQNCGSPILKAISSLTLAVWVLVGLLMIPSCSSDRLARKSSWAPGRACRVRTPSSCRSSPLAAARWSAAPAATAVARRLARAGRASFADGLAGGSRNACGATCFSSRRSGSSAAAIRRSGNCPIKLRQLSRPRWPARVTAAVVSSTIAAFCCVDLVHLR